MKYERIGVSTDWVAVIIAMAVLVLMKVGLINGISFY